MLPVPGDANEDGKVDVSDLGILAANYGTASGATRSMGDFNGDGRVDVADLGILAANYSTGIGSTSDFSADAGEMVETSAPGCGRAGLAMIGGLILINMILVKSDD